MYIKTVMTHNSLYIIDEEAETITRAPMGDTQTLRDDRKPISFLSYECCIGEPMRAICIDTQGNTFYRVTSPVLTIGTVTE